jgi:hypothetical protein
MKKKLKKIPALKKEAQLLCNLYIRERDKDKPCISCGQFKPYLQAGHYWAVGIADALRFDEDNIHGECPRCNAFDPCHLIGYTENLKERIGTERYEELKKRAEDYKKNGHKWSRYELTKIIEYYKMKLSELTII